MNRQINATLEALAQRLEAKAKSASKLFTLFIDDREQFGFHAADEKDAESKAKDYLLKRFGSFNRVKYAVKPEAPSLKGNVHDEWMTEAKGEKCAMCGCELMSEEAIEGPKGQMLCEQCASEM